MLISLRHDHKEHLSLLISQSTQVVIDFCKLSIDFLQNGPNLELYSSVAEKLSVEIDQIQNCVYGLVNLLMISCQHKLSEADFRDTVLTLNFSQEQQAVLSKFYDSKKAEISELLHKLTVNDTHFHDLEWRFEVQVSSRSLLQQVVPLVTMDLTLRKQKENGIDQEHQHVFLQTDPTNLLHVSNLLEKALMETRSRHSRKMQKALSST